MGAGAVHEAVKGRWPEFLLFSQAEFKPSILDLK